MPMILVKHFYGSVNILRRNEQQTKVQARKVMSFFRNVSNDN